MNKQIKNSKSELENAVDGWGQISLRQGQEISDKELKSSGGNPELIRAMGVTGVFKDLGDGNYLVTERDENGTYVRKHKVVANSLGPGHYFVRDNKLYYFNLSRSGIGTSEEVKRPTLRDLKYWGIGAIVGEVGQLAMVGGTSDKEVILQSLALPLGIMGAGLLSYI